MQIFDAVWCIAIACCVICACAHVCDSALTCAFHGNVGQYAGAQHCLAGDWQQSSVLQLLRRAALGVSISSNHRLIHQLYGPVGVDAATKH